jgi:hypothetical protein
VASPGQPPAPAPTQPPVAGVSQPKPTIVSEIPTPPTAADLANRRTKDFPLGVDVGVAAPGRLVKPGTGKDAYWIFREYTTHGMTSHQIKAIRDTVRDLERWRAVCARWAEVYGDDWRKFGHLDWYRNGIPGEGAGGINGNGRQNQNGALGTNNGANPGPANRTNQDARLRHVQRGLGDTPVLTYQQACDLFN